MKQKTFDSISEKILEQLLLEYARTRSISGSIPIQSMLEKIMISVCENVVKENFEKVSGEIQKVIKPDDVWSKIKNAIELKIEKNYMDFRPREMARLIDRAIQSRINQIVKSDINITDKQVVEGIAQYVKSLIKGVEVERTWRGTKVVIEFN